MRLPTRRTTAAPTRGSSAAGTTGRRARPRTAGCGPGRAPRADAAWERARPSTVTAGAPSIAPPGSIARLARSSSSSIVAEYALNATRPPSSRTDTVWRVSTRRNTLSTAVSSVPPTAAAVAARSSDATSTAARCSAVDVLSSTRRRALHLQLVDQVVRGDRQVGLALQLGGVTGLRSAVHHAPAGDRQQPSQWDRQQSEQLRTDPQPSGRRVVVPRCPCHRSRDRPSRPPG